MNNLVQDRAKRPVVADAFYNLDYNKHICKTRTVLTLKLISLYVRN